MGVKKWMARGVASVLGAGLGLALGEVLLRSLDFEFQLYPTKVQFGWPDPGAIQDLYRVDEDLLWVPKDYAGRLASARESRPRHVFMGCSCTEFGRYDEALARRMNAALPGESFDFVNLGVGGWSSFQGAKQLERDVVPIGPETVTIYFGWNDHWATFGIPDKEMSSYHLEHPRVLTWLTERSRVAQLVNRAFFAERFDGLTDELRVSLDDFEANLVSMVETARAHDIDPILLTAPSSHQAGDEPVYVTLRWLKDKDDLVPLHRAYVDKVREVASRLNVPLVDLFAHFEGLERDVVERAFQEDGVHLTDEGNEIIGEVLFEHFVE